MGAERLRRRDLVIPTPGVRAPTGTRLDPTTLRLVLRSGEFFSHSTAALVHGLPLPARFGDAPMHVTRIGDGPVMRRRGVISHRVAAALAEVELLGGMPVASPVSAWIACATLVGLDDLTILGDAVLHARQSLSREDLAEALAARPRTRGIALLRQALVLVREGAESPGETRLRLLLGRSGFPEPALNPVVRDARGRSIGRPDLAYPRERVALEYEGDYHRVDRETWYSDIRRRERFAAAGWRTIRVVADDLGPHAPELRSRLRAALRGSVGTP